MDKRTRKLLRHLERQGVRVERGSRHYKVKNDEGHLIAVLGTASDYRTWRNMRSNLRRHGIEIPESI